jgi:hypothetical protein
MWLCHYVIYLPLLEPLLGAWFAFGVIERLNKLETKNKLFEKDLLEASVQKPIDQEQFMLLNGKQNK